MNPFDLYVLSFLNQFAHRSWTFDSFVVLLSKNYVLKTGVITALLGWTWFRKAEDASRHRAILVFGLRASCAAIGLNRLLAFSMPFRDRPLRGPALDFVTASAIVPRRAVRGRLPHRGDLRAAV